MDMPAKKYIVELDAGERELLTGFISTGKTSAKAILKALSLIHISEPTRLVHSSRMPSSA